MPTKKLRVPPSALRVLKAVDLFCGAGGTSTGLIEAGEELGYNIELTAINHWDVAIATHKANHPKAHHLTSSIDNVNPRTLYKEGELDLLWASPECTNHSTARGGRPINDQSRATAHCVTRWAEALLPRIILVENVAAFLDWGPLKLVRRKVKIAKGKNKGRRVWRDDWVPIEERKGELFAAWIKMLECLGYRVQWRKLCCADYGDPTTRERLFVYAVRGKRRIIWPEPTHASNDKTVGLELFPRNVKPWVPARDIIDWSDIGKSIFGRKRPLVRKTIERILVGLHEFSGLPFILPHEGFHGGNKPRSVDKPLNTVTAAGRGGHIIHPELIPLESFLVNMKGQSNAASVDRPTPAITAHAPHLYLAEPALIKLRGTSQSHINSSGHSVNQPVPTVCANGQRIGLASPCLVEVNHGNGTDPNGNQRRIHSVDKPLKTVTSKNGIGLAHSALICMEHGGSVQSVDKPVPTITTAKGGAMGVSSSFLVKFNGTGTAYSLDKPLDTVTTKDRFGLVTAILERALKKNSKPPVVEINGEKFYLEIYFRMLKYRELSSANGFRADYQFFGTGTEIVRQIGNAVPRHTARALVRAALSQKP